MKAFVHTTVEAKLSSNLHVIPEDDYEPHLCSAQCWCQPVMNYRDPVTGKEVWVHARAKDGLQ